MGLFSWITSDTKQSIRVDKEKTVFMIAPDGRYWEEKCYEGYGEFGGKDIYELIAELNGEKSDRSIGIRLIFKDNPSGDFEKANLLGVKVPKLSSQLTDYENLEHSKNCPNQGFFFDEEEEE